MVLIKTILHPVGMDRQLKKVFCGGSLETPEHALIYAVLSRAIMDLDSTDRRVKREAVAWFKEWDRTTIEDTMSFKWVSFWLGLTPEMIERIKETSNR